MSPINRKKLLFFLLIILGSIIVFHLFPQPHHDQSPSPGVAPILDKKADLSLGKIQQTAMKDGKKEWTLVAEGASYFQDNKQISFVSPKITFYLEGQDNVILTADQGLLEIAPKDIQVTGHVFIQHGTYQIQTEKLHYQHNTRIISTNSPATIHGESISLASRTVTIDLDKNEIRMEGSVKGTLNDNFTF